jgi:hypothetical protein
MTGLGSFGRRRLKTWERPYGEVETLLVSANDGGDGKGNSPAEGRLQMESKDIFPRSIEEIPGRFRALKKIT